MKVPGARSGQSKKHQTQWAAQFFVAAELTRRGYLTALTLGNAPAVDLLVISPKGVQFAVDVKGQSTRNFWLLQNREGKEGMFYILVHVPPQEPPQFFIMGSRVLMKEREDYKKHIDGTTGKYRDDLGGINWGTALAHKDAWSVLPE